MVFVTPRDHSRPELPCGIINTRRRRGEALRHVACCVWVLLLLTCTHKTPEEDSGVIFSCCVTKTFYFSVNHPCAVMSHVPNGRVCFWRSDWHLHLKKLSDGGGITRDMAKGKPAGLLVLFLCGTTLCLVRYLFYSWNYFKRTPDGRNILIHTWNLFPDSPHQKCLVGDFFQRQFFITEVLLLHFHMYLCYITRCCRLWRGWWARSRHFWH